MLLSSSTFLRLAPLVSLFALFVLVDFQQSPGKYFGSGNKWNFIEDGDSRSVMMNSIVKSVGGVIDAVVVSLARNVEETNSTAVENNSTNVSDSDTVISDRVPIVDRRFRRNTMEWLEGTRLSNVEEDPEYMFHQILASETAMLDMDRLTDRSICHESGTFRRPSTNWNVTNEAQVKEWTLRLAYLAIHSLQHGPAWIEARLRTKYPPTNRSVIFNVSSWDYECRDARFLITAATHQGMGASFRLGIVNAILGGIATGRVTILVNNIPSDHVPRAIKDAWPLGSCSRQDMQCAFLPTTPCVITMDDLVNRTMIMPEQEARLLRRRGIIVNTTLAAHRYVYMESKALSVPDKGAMRLVKRNIANKARELIAISLENSVGDSSEKTKVLEEALNRLQRREMPSSDDATYTYSYRDDIIHHAVMLYTLRLRKHVHHAVETKVKKIFSTSFEPQKSIGIPIRASDKCMSESTCLNFQTYMELAHEVFSENFEGNGSVIVTTEAVEIAEASRRFQSPHLSLVMNMDDSFQNTGRPRLRIFNKNADLIMESSLIALKMQLYSKRTFGNCCSNFHLLLFDLIRSGCGLGEAPLCLQETKNPKYHVCCQWTKTDECNIMWGRVNVTES